MPAFSDWSIYLVPIYYYRPQCHAHRHITKVWHFGSYTRAIELLDISGSGRVDALTRPVALARAAVAMGASG